MKEAAASLALIELLHSGKFIEVSVQGDSMHPALKNGDIIGIHPLLAKESLRIGDILALDIRQNWLVVHRLIFITKKNGQLKLFIKGDAKLRFDVPCQFGNVLGKVVLIKRGEQVINLTNPLEKFKAFFIAGFSGFSAFARFCVYGFTQKDGN